MNLVSFILIPITIYFVFFIFGIILKKRGYKSYTEQEISLITKEKIPLWIKIVYWTNIILFFILMLLPAVLIMTRLGDIQRYLFTNSDVHYFMGVSMIITSLIQVFVLFLTSCSMAIIVCAPLYIYFPQFEVYEMQMRSKKKNLPEIYNLKIKNAELKIIKLAFIFLPVFVAIAFFALYDYTKINDNYISQQYFFKKSEFTWSQIGMAKLTVDYKKDEKYQNYNIWPKMSFTIKGSNEEINVWRDNGFVKPTKEELLWLIDKIDREKIKLEVISVPDYIRTSIPKEQKGYWDRVDPVLQKALSVSLSK